MAGTVTRPTAPATRQAPPLSPAPAPPLRTPAPVTRTVAPAVRLGSAAPVNIAGGEPLAPTIRTRLERSFNANLEAVRVHSDPSAHDAAANAAARAFTYGNHIFLGRGERADDVDLLAHETAHVIQQRSAPAVQRWTLGPSNVYEREAQQAAQTVRSGGSFTVRERTVPRVQRLGLSDALNYFADKANLIPGFRMFTIVLGVNPINMSAVPRTAANILRGMVELIPVGVLLSQAMENAGVFERAGAFVEQQIQSLGMTAGAIRQAINQFLDSLSWSDIFDLGGVWERAKRIFTEPIRRLIDFAGGLVSGIIGFIKDAILMPLARLAEGTQGWDLLIAVLGRNPITGEAVPRNADTLIGGFMKLIGQEEVWENIKRGNAVARAWAWFQGALSGLLGFVQQLPGLFVQTLQSLELTDIVLVPRAFIKVGRVFVGFLGNFISWAGAQVLTLLQIIVEVVAPGVMPYIRRAAGAFRKIIENPIAFVGNLVRAGIQGFRQFAGNFLTHLRASLIGWLTGTMSGANIYIPQGFNLREILKFVLSVLGLTWQNIRGKLVRVIGETAVRAMETGFEIVVTLVTQGPAAAWQQIVEGISNLREMVMEQIMTFVRDRVVQAAITRLVTSLNPAGAFIQAIIATYNTIMFFVERLRQIAQVVGAFIDSIAAIADGVIGAAANRVEQTMAGLLTLVISFLARIAGLGRVSDAVTNIINRVRAPIDRALDRVVNWIVTQARRLGRFIAQAGVPQDPNERLRLAAQAAVTSARRMSGRATRPLLVALLAGIRVRYGLRSIEPYQQAGNWWVRASINPDTNQNLGIPSLVGPDGRTPLAEHQSRVSSARTPEGPNIQPIIAKLTQAVQMFTVWARLNTSPVAQPMLRALEMARDEAQAIYEAQTRGVPLTQVEARKQSLAARLRAIQTRDPEYALISIGELSVTLTNARRQMAVITPPAYTMLNPSWRPEYERQLQDQQDGINAMTAEQWLQNRNQFGTSGRSSLGTRLQRTFQRRMGNPPQTAAPHNPDQGMAGFADPTGTSVVWEVNSHIGSQLPSRVPTILTAVNAIDPAARLITQMNVRLEVV